MRPGGEAVSDAPLVSVITLTYNQEAFLPQCVESILAQTCTSWEQVIVDDESTDGTAEVLARYADPRLRVIRQPHQGAERVPQTYQKALAMCRGRFIGFADGDDYYSHDQLATLLPAFDDPDVVLSFGPTRLFGDLSPDNPPTIPNPDFYTRFPRGALFNTPRGAATRAMLDPNALTFPFPVSVLIRRSALDRLGGLVIYPGLPIVDYTTFLHLTLEGRFHYVDKPMGFWRVHGSSISNRRRDVVLAGVYSFIQEFRRLQAARLNLTTAQWHEVDRAWDEFHISRGRVALENQLWKDARTQFLRPARHGSSRELRAVALAGITASFLRRDLSNNLEWIFKRRVAPLLARR
jgi:hypothetical protein